MPSLRCYSCHEFGHLAKDCKNTPKGKGSYFKCSNTGHQASFCALGLDKNFEGSAKPESTYQAGSRNNTTAVIEEMNKVPLHLLKEDSTEPVLERVPIKESKSTNTILLSN